jgi:type IV pilus assembly protein PilM
MALKKFNERILKFFQPGLPPISCEISQEFVSVVRLNAKDPVIVERSVVTPIPEGLVAPSLSQPNIKSIPNLSDFLKSSLARAEIKTNKISVAVPDSSVKVAILSFDKLPGNENERQQLLKWRLKKTTPFNVEDSHLAYYQQQGANGKISVVTVVIYREVLAQYETLFRGLGMQAGFITPASLAAFELLARSEPSALKGSILFLHWNSSSLSALIVRETSVVFFRHLDYFEGEGRNGAGLESLDVTEKERESIYDEIHPCLMYYQDKLGDVGVDKIYILAHQELGLPSLEFLSQKTGSPVVNMDPLRLFRSYPAGCLPMLKNALAPALGLALGSA